MARPFGVYVHFPYCAHRCPYCDFAVTTEPVPAERRYARAVLAELALRAPAFAGLSPVSVYLGGGTPSLWEPDEVAEVLVAIRARFGVPEGAEVTIEANPESCDRDRLRALRSAGVSRVSVGAQSFDPGVLAKLGRRHGPEAAERAIGTAADEIGNASVDLIYGARRSSVAIARADAARAAAAGAVHVSAYQLTLDQDLLAEDVPLARMRRAGRLPTAEEDRIDPRAERNERLMLALRTLRGMPLGALSAAQTREAAEAVRRRLAVRRGGRLVLTSRGMDLHSALSERLFE